MASGLEFSYTDPGSGANYPTAFLVIYDTRGHIGAGLWVASVSIYATQALFQSGKDPIYTNPELYLTGTEIATETPALMNDLYTLLAARAQFAGATIVA